MTLAPDRPHLLLAALFFQGMSGVAGGVALVADPTGRSIGIPLDWLAGSPFADYFIPGVFLLTVLGVAPLAVAFLQWKHADRSTLLSLVVGVVLVVWIAVEIAVIGYQASPPLQLIYGALGLAIIFLSVREYAEVKQTAGRESVWPAVGVTICRPQNPPVPPARAER